MDLVPCSLAMKLLPCLLTCLEEIAEKRDPTGVESEVQND